MKTLLIFLLCLKQVDWAFTGRKFVHQKDMSEYCRRRVVPSVFLGTHVAEAHSKILHFSKLELPYSCLVSVRGELGSNLILVAQLISDKSLMRACDLFPNQLLVYEMGETFGGYWGPLPEILMRPSPTAPAVYVHKATRAKPSPTQLKVEIETTTTKTTDVTLPTDPKPEFFAVELPLLNLTGHVENFPGGDARVFDVDDSFDMLFDVTPGFQEQYETSVVPMLQFSIGQSVNGRRFGTDTMFDVEYADGLITPQTRWMLPHFSIRATKKRKLSTKKKYEKVRPVTKQRTFYSVIRKQSIDSKLQYENNVSSFTTERSWAEIEELLKGLKETELGHTNPINESEHITEILEALSKLNHNHSVYLQSIWKSNENDYQKTALNKYNLELFTRKILPHVNLATRNINQLLKSTMILSTTVTDSKDKIVVENTTQVIMENNKKTVKNNLTYSISDKDNLIQTPYTVLEQSTKIYNVTMPIVSKMVETKDAKNITQMVPSRLSSASVTPLTGSMVDHESWENVVQVAPVMAVLLNRTVSVSKTDADANITVNTKFQKNTTNAMRKKRRILPIPIENARPHTLTTRDKYVTAETRMFYASDMADLAQLFELQDDELHDRVALRYLRQYVGPILFNICDYTEPKSRQVFLFNSSRIVVAISNFTLEKMSVILTPARTLFGGSSTCPSWNLECQVFGTRVCIDKINACDGVPNCGTFDIYDEDRLTCGAAIGLQHNVYLAAMTFIAVLLTMLYTIHYWLKRCVPQVSEAFFIYTDRAENTLYLESIMRSPHDMESNFKTMYHENLFMTEDLSYENTTKIKHRNICYRMWRCCFEFITCRCKRRMVSDLNLEIGKNFNKKPSKIFSFTEFELQKFGKQNIDISVQTGDSLEMPFKKNIYSKKTQQGVQPISSLDSPSTSFDSDSRKQSKELKILKLLKETKTQCKEPCHCIDASDKSIINEKELYSYDLHPTEVYTNLVSQSNSKPKQKLDVYSPIPGSSKQATKRLRFDEEIFTIPTSDIDEEEVPLHPVPAKDTHKTHIKDAGKMESVETNAGINRDRKRFWTPKNKKSKKKTHLALY